MSAELGAAPPTDVDDRVYAASAHELLRVVHDLPADARTAVLVGHNPGLEDLAIRSAVLAAVNAIYSFTLPHSPPSRSRTGPSAAGKALRMLRDPSFAVFVASLFVAQLFSA